ncbi:hypothetical protein CS022_00520 [Veronia nyctiphanis]|uniref:Uncharacterized protein n=1 Tax=Veronia nyctiphanis TaxID=1278244 RepID=A0A4Q0YTY4_9GAMM|nr:hypothetical protein CS022_00520 [Veronia nyctiphanis]
MSVGAGAIINYANVKVGRYVGSFAQVFDTLKPTDIALVARMDGFGFGYNVGALYEFNEDHRMGVSYRGKSSISLDNGELSDFTGRYIPADGGTTGVKMTLDLPDVFEFSGYHRIFDDWAFHYDVMWTGWSALAGVTIKDKTGDTCMFNREPDKLGICVSNPIKLEDSFRYAVGATHYFNDDWTFRTGFAFDEQAAETSVVLPDMNTITAAVGATWQFNSDLSFDFGFSANKRQTAEFIDKDLTFKQPYLFRVTRSAIFLSLGFNYEI